MKEVPVFRCRLERTGSLRVPYDTTSRTSHAAEVLRCFLGEPDREHFACLYLDRENLIIGCELVSLGTQDRVGLWVEHIFRGAVVSGCDKLIVAHNHVRSPAKPSHEDRVLTRELVKAGKILGIRVVDHIILACDEHYSFHDHGGMRSR